MNALRVALGVLATAVLALLALAGMLWVWSSASTSLATSLEQLARYLPSGQTLEVKEVKGSLQGGGRIGWLRWQKGELSVEAHTVSLAWALPALLDGELRLGQISIGQLHIDDRRPASGATAPTELRLPLRVDAPFAIDTLVLTGATSLQISGLAGHYSFDDREHRLDISTARIAAGSYRLNGRLQAQPPMALALQVQGSVQTTLPSGGQTVQLQAQASVQGNLARPDAVLELQAQLTPGLLAAADGARQSTGAGNAMQASVTARLQPWQAQPVTHASARWQALNLAQLWPQAPQTLMDGDATVTPAGPGWHAGIKLSNALAGPWDKQRLPIRQLDARLVYMTGQWTIESLTAAAAGGRVEAHGTLAGAAWQGSASAFGINPAGLDSRLAATRLDGQLTAQQTADGIAVDGRLQTDDSALQGQLTFNSAPQAVQGQLALTLPGGTVNLKGHLASSRGEGEIAISVKDAALAARWLARWPGAPALPGQVALQGRAELTGSWHGGWQQQAQDLQVRASVRSPGLELQQAGQPASQGWRLYDGQADISGTLRALTVSLRGQADQASRHFAIQLLGRAARLGTGVWKTRLETAQLNAQDSLHPGLWSAQLNEPVAIDWQQSEALQALTVSGASAGLTGPVGSAATVSWQASQWSQQSAPQQGATRWQSQGTLQGLPLAWLALLGQTPMANLGLRGDLVFGGQWEAAGGEQLRLRATLERSSGDLQLQTEAAADGTGATYLQAGVRAARLALGVDGEQLSASLRWDSERAGQVQADFSTRLLRQQGNWSWPAGAPLSGTLRAQLPDSGAWSLLAPPGWRLRGTLDARASVAGTRSAPQWQGSLQAQDLALRSVVDGIDLSKGTLRASLSGQRLDIESLTLQGAGGTSGGLLSVSGAVLWLPATAPGGAVLSRLSMALDAQARSLRVSSRADQRLVVSGKLSAQLDNARLSIRGALKADAALFILAQDSAPQLGDDVQVRTREARPAAPASAASAPPVAATAQRRVTPDVLVNLDLGDNFEVRGRGLLTHLSGTLTLRSSAAQVLAPQLSGQLRTVGGTYQAYGQQLDIEEGILYFSGPIDNPALDILALRPNLQQRVGVQINGSVLSPVVRLYAEPDLPEAEKLAWLVVGRAAANGGAEAAMLQQAALALLGGKGNSLSGGLAQSLGLDELSVRGIAASNADGTAAGATITLGKRVSRNFYVAYERSLAGALGTFYIFYDLSRRFTLRAQTGEQSAVDLIFTLRYDHAGP